MIVNYDYDKFSLNDILSGKKIVVPSFQRNVVWSSKKRMEFIKTLRKGNPFGSILVHKDGDKYTLIDGLQRISTIKDFSLNPYKYFTYEDLNFDIIYELVEYDFDQQHLLISKNDLNVNRRCEEIQKYIFDMISKNNTWNDIFYDCIDKFGLYNSRESREIFDKLEKDFDEQRDIQSLIVPAIIYNGPSEELAELFFNLNTGGVNLSKYETLSASWGVEKFIVDDKEILNKIFEKYEKIKENSELDVEVAYEDLSNEGITIFEYCYAISEILRGKDSKYDIILGKNKKSTDPVGFEILSLICGLNVNKADLLYDKFKNCSNSNFFASLKNAIVNTFDVIFNALKPWLYAKNGKPNMSDSTYMIYHMVISYFCHNYKLDLDNYELTIITNKEWNRKYCKNLHLYYFKDYISDYWKKNRQVADLMREIKNPESLDKYVRTISNDEWDRAFMELKNNQLEEVTSQINVKAKMFIDYLVKFKINENRMLDKYFDCSIDYEHIIPQVIFTKQLSAAERKTFPISSLGNICYLAGKDNKAKHDHTIYEYSEDRPSFCLNDDYLSLISYPSKEDINFIENRSDEFRIRYKEFITFRIDTLIEEMKEYLRKM